MVVTTGTIGAAGAFNGVSTGFPLSGLHFLDAADLRIAFVTAAGATAAKVLGDDYTLTGNSRTGSATLHVPLAKQSGFTGWRADRETQIKQDVRFLSGTGAPAEAQEKQHDRLAMVLQEMRGFFSRMFLAPPGDTLPVLPPAALRKSKLLGFNALGALALFAQADFKGDKGDQGDKGPVGGGNTIGFQVDDYCTENTPAGNMAGFAALSAAINEAGGGVVDFTPGKEYLLGDQTFRASPVGVLYNWLSAQAVANEAAYGLKLVGCTKAVVVRGNGAQLKTAPGQRYGVFNNDGSPKNDIDGPGLATPLHAFVHLENCTGKITVENLDIDGNIQNLIIGGPFGDTGIQIPFTGLNIQNCPGGVLCENLNVVRCGLDGLHYDGPALDDAATIEQAIFNNCSFLHNGRNNTSLVGGKGPVFNSCKFNGSGTNEDGTPGPVASNPGAGVDQEAEGGKAVRGAVYNVCEFVGNRGPNFIADSGTDVNDTQLNYCTLIGTTNYAAWFNRPGFRINGGKIVGTVVFAWSGLPASPFDAAAFAGVRFTNDPAHSPMGTVYQVNNLFLESVGGYVRFDDCLFDYLGLPGSISSNGSTDETRFHNCTIQSRGGTLTLYGRFSGRTVFRESGTGQVNVPGGGNVIVGRANLGHAEDAWELIDANNARILYPATIDRSGNVLWTDTIGDESKTIEPGGAAMHQLANAELTADRTITLGTAGTAQGFYPAAPRLGQEFHFTRTGGGAFLLNIAATSGTKALAQNTWARFRYRLAGWQIVSSGSL
ncbi:MAG TPA: hypothetical protein VGB70_12700 [Allosphingosinicella sp.]|jgi:hypothetical protein